MRNRLYCVAISALSLATADARVCSAMGARDTADMSIVVQPASTQLLLGELVSLTVKIANRGGSEQEIPRNTGVGTGNIRIFIAYRDQPFKEYRGPHFGVLDAAGPNVVLKPGDSVETSATVLFNHVPQTAHLSQLYAGQYAEERIETSYAFPRAGVYRVRAVLTGASGAGQAESAPVRIVVREPTGVEQGIWAELRENPDVAYFMQEGSTRLPLSSESSQEVIRIANRIIAQAPNSRYARSMKAGLEKLRREVGNRGKATQR